jgi:hypothetical protein
MLGYSPDSPLVNFENLAKRFFVHPDARRFKDKEFLEQPRNSV